jgi:hypothetical protein
MTAINTSKIVEKDSIGNKFHLNICWFLFAATFFVVGQGFSQQVFLDEGFENGGTMPGQWSNEHVLNTRNWYFANGGYTNDPEVPNSRRPVTAYKGSYNALFELQTISPTITKLVSKPMDLTLAIKPKLDFYYANYPVTFFGESEYEKIRVYYRSETGTANQWVLIHEILDYTEEWTKAEVLIPDSAKFADLELAFEGEVGPGWGACIDEVKVYETEIVSKYVDGIVGVQPTTANIPTGAEKNPVLGLSFTVKGNSGELKIDTLRIEALENTMEILDETQVNVFYTKYSSFSIEEMVSANINLVNNTFVLTNLDKDLPFGTSYLWITYDIPEDPLHEYSGKKVDAKLLAGNLVIGNSILPNNDINPAGVRVVSEAIFFDGFELLGQWGLSGEFEIDAPDSLGGAYGFPDPEFAYKGSKVLGTDLTGMGLIPGDCEYEIDTNEYQAISPIVNCRYYKDVKIHYYQWLNTESSDVASIDISLSDPYAWDSVWQNLGVVKDGVWTPKFYNLSLWADRRDTLVTRFAMGPTDDAWSFSGWNIDDFAILGTFVKQDAGIASILAPVSGCGHDAPEAVTVKVKNYGYEALSAGFEVGYSVDNGATWVKETLPFGLAQEEQKEYTFTQLVDLTALGKQSLWVRTFLNGDQDDRNNEKQKEILILPTYSLPYAQNFEQGDDYWYSYGNKTWVYGKPQGTELDSAFSGRYCWGTTINGYYPNNDSSWLESPCFNFSAVEKPMVEFMYMGETELSTDGMALYYSIDKGANWLLIENTSPYPWNWNNATVSSMGTEGWDNSQGDWLMARQLLPDGIAGESEVKFRFLFVSNASDTTEGFLIDDVRFYEAPLDVGVSALTAPVSECYLSNEETVKLTIENFGIRTVNTNEPLYAFLQFNQEEEVLADTFYFTSAVATGESEEFEFTPTVSMTDSGNYSFVLYTSIEQDSAVFTAGTVNDTLKATVRFQGEPLYSLGPDIGTTQPDTVVLDAGDYSVYEWQDGSVLQTFNVPDSGSYSVTVTNSEGCTMVDTIQIIKSITDLAITNVIGLNSSCIDAQSPALQIELTNMGDSTYEVGDVLQVAYYYEGGGKNIESITLDAQLATGGNVSYSFFNQPVFVEEGTIDVFCFPVVEADLDYSNDTMSVQIELYPLAALDLGEDTIYSAMQTNILLDAGTELHNFKWHDNSSLQTFEISSKMNGKYYVEAQDLHDCSTVSDTVWVYTEDWVLDSILSPSTACSHTNSEPVVVTLINNSNNAYPVNTVIPGTIIIDGLATMGEFTLNSSINGQASGPATFNTTFNMQGVATYTLESKIHPQIDIDTLNNYSAKEIETYGIYTVDLGADTIITKQADTILFDAGQEFSLFSWNTGNNQRYLPVQELFSYNYKVTVEDPHHCKISSDSVQVLSDDISLVEIVSPKSACNIGDVDKIALKIKNEGFEDILQGVKLSVLYSLNNSSYDTISYTLPSLLSVGEARNIYLNKPLELNEEDENIISVKIRYDNDFFAYNDTLTTKVKQYPTPDLDLGDDIRSSRADTIIIDAGEGDNFLWGDMSSGRYYSVSQNVSASYSCTESNAYGCSDADTINVVTFDFEPGTFKDLTACEAASITPEFALHLVSGDTLQANDSIEVYYVFESTVITEKITLTDTLTSAEDLNHIFNVPIEISDTGDYSITYGVNYHNDVKASNNEVGHDFRIGAHLVDLGDDIYTKASNLVLDAGGEFISYDWNTLENTQSIVVNYTNTYTVTVTDINGCSSSDDVYVEFIVGEYAITNFVGLADSCSRENKTKVSFELENKGNDTVGIDDPVSVQLLLNGTTVPVKDVFLNSALLPNKLIQIAYPDSVDLKGVGSYNLRASVAIGDKSAQRDTILRTYGLPIANLSDTINTYNETVMLDAGNPGAEYLWSNAATTQSIEVSSSGTYYVTVISSFGCITTDSTHVHFITPGYMISDVIGISNACSHTNQEVLSMRIENTGNDVVEQDSVISVQYSINGTGAIVEQYRFEEDFLPGESVVVSFTSLLDLSQTGTYSISVGATFGATEPSKTITVETYGYPSFSLGADTTSSEESLVLTGPDNMQSYNWSTGENTQSLEVDVTNMYWLEVSSMQGCLFRDSILVTFVVSGVGIQQFYTPQGLILYKEDLNPKIQIVNNGERVLEDGSELVFAFKYEEDEVVEEQFELEQAIGVGETFDYTFSTNVDVYGIGNHPIAFYLNVDGEWMDTVQYYIPVNTLPQGQYIIDKLSPEKACEVMPDTNTVLQLQNVSGIVIPDSVKFTLVQIVDEGTEQSEEMSIEEDWENEQLLEHVVQASYNFNAVGDHTLKYSLKYRGNLLQSVDYIVKVFANPDFGFSTDSIKVGAYPYTLNAGVDAEWYHWNTGATTQSIEVDEDGTYSLTITDINACSASDSIVVVLDTWYGEEWVKDISVYPNPTSEYVFLEYNNENLLNAAMEIYSVDGGLIVKEIWNENPKRINIGNLEPGLYILRIVQEGNWSEFKIIKQ